MIIKQVAAALATAGFREPTLNALEPNVSNYSVLLLQPGGLIDACANGVRNRDRALADRQFSAFLRHAADTNADLVITPEYSMPWDTLVRSLQAGIAPKPGKLWVLGCESIRLHELEHVRATLGPGISVIFETLDPDPGRFLDPLAYVFVGTQANGDDGTQVVLLVQFKTFPMGDVDHFEINGLHRGTEVYQFGGTVQPIKLLSLICSDAFAFTDAHAQQVYDRALIIHIQLNEEPRHTQFSGYRAKLLGLNGDATEIISLNWARFVRICCGGQEKEWDNLAGTAWYLKPAQFDCRDATLSANHRLGLYYTWFHDARANALFFNFDSASFLLEATKVVHVCVPAVVSRRVGPRLVKTRVWSEAAADWVDQPSAEDGFAAEAAQGGGAAIEIRRVAARDPLEAERVLALCAGEIGTSDEWHSVRQLDSCRIQASEVIHRLTFCQDTRGDSCTFRARHLSRCGYLWGILNQDNLLPQALADLSQGFSFNWSAAFPHQNLLSAKLQRATGIYVGEETGRAGAEATYMRVAEYFRRSMADYAHFRAAKQRLAVWYRQFDGAIRRYVPGDDARIDLTGQDSEFDIGRESCPSTP